MVAMTMVITGTARMASRAHGGDGKDEIAVWKDPGRGPVTPRRWEQVEPPEGFEPPAC